MTHDSESEGYGYTSAELRKVLGDLTLRTARSSDGPRVLNLVDTVLREFGLEIEPDGIDADLNDIELTYLRNGGAFLVLEGKDGSLVGSVGLFREDKTTCQLRKMYLAPTLRGCGLGKYLLHYVIERARESGFKQMTLETSSKLAAANSLYTRFGFHPIKLESPSKRADQAYAIDL